jgi:hypothetical protein
MSIDALVLTALAIMDFALIVHLRRRHGRRASRERMMASLRMAIRRADVEDMQMRRPFMRAS